MSVTKSVFVNGINPFEEAKAKGFTPTGKAYREVYQVPRQRMSRVSRAQLGAYIKKHPASTPKMVSEALNSRSGTVRNSMALMHEDGLLTRAKVREGDEWVFAYTHVHKRLS